MAARQTPRQQLFNPGELPLVLLALLAETPRNRYELLGELARLFGPDYRPSPGSVYPAIAALRDEGLITVDDPETRRTYRLSATGRAALAKRRKMLAELEVRTGVRIGDDNDVRAALDRFASRVEAVAARTQITDIEVVLDRAAAEIETLGGKP